MANLDVARRLSLELSDCIPESIVEMNSLSSEAMSIIFCLAKTFEKCNPNELVNFLRGGVFGSLFYQPSTRTRLNFESAAQRLGLSVIGFSDPQTTRAGDFYQESLEDVVRFTSELCDIMAIRHFENGAAKVAAQNSIVPIINAGDGYNQHPTQALGDIFTMIKCLDTLGDKTIGMIGDLNVRSLKSITIGLSQLGVHKLLFKVPDKEKVPAPLLDILDTVGTKYSFVDSINELLFESDLVETIGINHPDHNKKFNKFEAGAHSNDKQWIITRKDLDELQDNAPYILHPAPRTNEITTCCDSHPKAKYFEQARNGMWIRMALISGLMARKWL